VKADDFVRTATNVGEGSRVCGWRDSPGYELAERAIIVLMNARTLRSPMGLGVRPDCCRCHASSSGCIDDADDARQESLGKGADDYPTANCSRESYSWCHVTWVRTLTAVECNDHSRSDQDAQPSARSFVLARVARTVEKTFVFE
jgi:hypothetical protein